MEDCNDDRTLGAVSGNAAARRSAWRMVVDFFLMLSVGFLIAAADATFNRAAAATVDVMSTTYSKNGSVFSATVEARHRNLPEVSGSRWTTATANLTAKQVGMSGLRALRRGATHPLLLAAMTAANLYYDSQTDEFTLGSETEPTPQPAGTEWLLIGITKPTTNHVIPASQRDVPTGWYSTKDALLADLESFINSVQPDAEGTNCTYNSSTREINCTAWVIANWRNAKYAASQLTTEYPQSWVDNPDYTYSSGGLPTVLSDDQASNELGPHLSAQAMQNLSEGGHGMAPYDYGDPIGQQSGEYPDELINAIALQHEELLHQLDPDNNPAPDESVTVDPKTSDERMEDELNEAPPAFGDVDIDWNVENYSTIDPYQTGLSSTAECPASTVVTVPLLGEFQIDYAPMCTLADWLRPAVLAVALLFGVIIVVRGD